MRIVKSKQLLTKAALICAAFFLLNACKIVKQSDFHGHWWVIEENAGYLEFACWSDTMYVCSPKYGKVYYGRYEVKKNNLIQYHGFSDSVRIVGVVTGNYPDSAIDLRYDESLEQCLLISKSIPEINSNGRFVGIESREPEN